MVGLTVFIGQSEQPPLPLLYLFEPQMHADGVLAIVAGVAVAGH